LLHQIVSMSDKLQFVVCSKSAPIDEQSTLYKLMQFSFVLVISRQTKLCRTL